MLEQLVIKAADYIKPAGSTLEECKSAQQQCNVTAGAICVFTTQENVKDTDRAPTLYFIQGVVSLYRDNYSQLPLTSRSASLVPN